MAAVVSLTEDVDNVQGSVDPGLPFPSARNARERHFVVQKICLFTSLARSLHLRSS